MSLYLGTLLSQCVQNVIQISYMCLLFNGVADISTAPTENAWFRPRLHDGKTQIFPCGLASHLHENLFLKPPGKVEKLENSGCVNWEKRGFRFSRSFYAPENASRHVSALCLQFVWLSWMLIRLYSFLRLCKCFWSVYN